MAQLASAWVVIKSVAGSRHPSCKLYFSSSLGLSWSSLALGSGRPVGPIMVRALLGMPVAWEVRGTELGLGFNGLGLGTGFTWFGLGLGLGFIGLGLGGPWKGVWGLGIGPGLAGLVGPKLPRAGAGAGLLWAGLCQARPFGAVLRWAGAVVGFVMGAEGLGPGFTLTGLLWAGLGDSRAYGADLRRAGAGGWACLRACNGRASLGLWGRTGLGLGHVGAGCWAWAREWSCLRGRWLGLGRCLELGLAIRGSARLGRGIRAELPWAGSWPDL
ncbi:hypothetical protein FNV43_RR05178 [Rhamnella rubrinervis]|uniref:Uncharacterized protein n=1 Tax=Rhamnella rubrinervis TaxID=2594499 RepID=A0A8K0MRB9_9ROSA|nr:hypothetical protein FNV43_RR05178 [Rhamnella rubrinervis]